MASIPIPAPVPIPVPIPVLIASPAPPSASSAPSPPPGLSPGAAATATPPPAPTEPPQPQPQQRLHLPDVLRALPPDLVRQIMWLRLSRAERAALRLVCRDLRDSAGAKWVRDLQLLVTPHPDVPSELAPAADGATAVGAPAPALNPPPAQPIAPPPPPHHRRLHDSFTGPHSVTLRLLPGRSAPPDSAGTSAAASAAASLWGGRQPDPVAALAAGAAAASAAAQGPTARSRPIRHDPEAPLLLQHFNDLHLPTSVVHSTPAAAAAVATAADPTDIVRSRAAAALPHRGAEATAMASAIPAGAGGGGGGEQRLFVALGVCRSARVVQALGLPYDLALRRPFLKPLAAAYPDAEQLILRCTAPRCMTTSPQASQLHAIVFGSWAPPPAHVPATPGGEDAVADVPALAALLPRLSSLEFMLLGPRVDYADGAWGLLMGGSAAALPARAPAALTRLLSSRDLPPPLQLRSLCLGGVVLTSDLLAAVVQLTGLEELRLRLALPPPAAAAALLEGKAPGGGGGNDGDSALAELPRWLAALRWLRRLSVGLYGMRDRWLEDAAAAAREVRRAESAAATEPKTQRAGAACGGTAGGAAGVSAAAGARTVGGIVRPGQLRCWADLFSRPGGAGGTLTCLELPQLALEGPLLQAVQRCPALTSLSALGLGDAGSGGAGGDMRGGRRSRRSQQRRPQQQEHQAQGSTPLGDGVVEAPPQGMPVAWRLRRLRLADVRLGRPLLDLLCTAPDLRQLALGLSLGQFQLLHASVGQRPPAQAAAVPLPPAGAAAVTTAERCDGDWRPRFAAAAAQGEALAAASAAAAVGMGGVGPWRELLAACCGCVDVQLVVCGSLDWVEVVGWLAGALGRRLSMLGLQTNSPYAKRNVGDADLAAVAYGLPYLRRLHLMSYGFSVAGLLRLASMPALQDLRFDMKTFLSYIPSEVLLDLAEAFAWRRRAGGGGSGGGASDRHEHYSCVSPTDADARAGSGSGSGGNVGRTRVSTTPGAAGAAGQPQSQIQPQDPPLIITATFLSERQAAGLNDQLSARMAGVGGHNGGGGGGGGSGSGVGGGGVLPVEGAEGTDPWVVPVRVVADSPDLLEEADEEWW